MAGANSAATTTTTRRDVLSMLAILSAGMARAVAQLQPRSSLMVLVFELADVQAVFWNANKSMTLQLFRRDNAAWYNNNTAC